MSAMRDLSAQSARFKIYKPMVGSGTAARIEGLVVGWGTMSNRCAYSRSVGAHGMSEVQIGWKISRI